jgi:UDP:flavonoid glycosyltransferase YjiC (YdhE family)
MARFLICTLPVTGHVNPGLPIARALVRRGHEVRWYTGRKFRAAIEATGARYVPMQAGYDYDDSETDVAFAGRAGRSGLAGLKWDLKHLFYDLLPGQLTDLRSILRDFPADALLADTGFLGAGALHELGGPPYAVYGITALTLGSRDTAPFGTALSPDASPVGRLRNRALDALFRRVIFRDVATYADDLLRTLGLQPLQGSVFDIRAPFLYLQSSTLAFEYPRSDLAPQVHFIGPLLPDTPPDFAPPAWWDDLGAGRRVVLVNQGTLATDPNDLIVPALRGLADEDVLLVATTGGTSTARLTQQLLSVDDAELFATEMGVTLNAGIMGGFGTSYHTFSTRVPGRRRPGAQPTLPANARVEPFIPFGALLPHVDVVVTNGGYGGVQFALAHGVPLVVAGATEEKPEIAARVAWSGAGINLKTRTPTPTQIRNAVRRVLASSGYRENARRIQADYARHSAPDEAAALLERLATTGQPVLRDQPSPQPLSLKASVVGEQ